MAAGQGRVFVASLGGIEARDGDGSVAGRRMDVRSNSGGGERERSREDDRDQGENVRTNDVFKF